jgi:hypothetical protein
VFSGSGTNIYSLEAAQASGTAWTAATVAANDASLLPPARVDLVEGYLADDRTLLPAATSFPERGYSAKLGLDYIGEPTLGFISSSYGSGFFGTASLYFGDMLGNRTLGLSIAAQGDIQDYGGEAFYLNTASRLNWGLGVGRQPYVSGFTTRGSGSVEVGGVPVPANIVEQAIRRTYYDQASIITQYPFSAGRRAEFDIGLTHVSYRTEVNRWYEFAGGVIGPERSAAGSPASISFGQASAALVGDNSFSGFTSPISGGRYRIEGSPMFGGLNLVSALADGRRYFFARPFTFAFRGMHFGRYGTDAEDERLTPLYVGSDQLVRGYDLYSFTNADCSQVSGDGCPEFERLIGSRIAVANAEIRVPLFGTSTFGLIRTNFLPIELAAFADAGMAWTRDEGVDLRFDRSTTDRVPVFSYGASARINLLGYLVVEVFHARPLQRTARSGIWGVQFVPGW